MRFRLQGKMLCKMKYSGVQVILLVFLICIQNHLDKCKIWRMRVSISLPLRCKRSALPIELIPLVQFIDLVVNIKQHIIFLYLNALVIYNF